MDNHCVMCGSYLADTGRMVCEKCEKPKTAKQRFWELRKKVMKAISEIDLSYGCKSYEGTFEWTICYPNYFEDETGDCGASCFVLTLHCYVLGPARHYDWMGKTMDEALDKAEKDICVWIGEEDGK